MFQLATIAILNGHQQKKHNKNTKNMTKTKYHDIRETQQPSHHGTGQCRQSPFSMAALSVHLSFTANSSATELRMCGENYGRCVDTEESNSACE